MIKKESSFYLDCMRNIWVDNLKDKIQKIATLELKKEKISHKFIGQFDKLEIFEELTFKFLHNELLFKHPDFSNDIEFSHNGFIISDCIFCEDITISALCNSIVFENCIFKKALNIKLYDHISFSEEIKKIDFKNITFSVNNCKIKNLTIKNSTFQSKFYINKQDENNTNQSQITKLEIDKVDFEQKFKLHNCLVDEVFIKDVDFQKNADFYKSKFIKGIDENDIYFKSINFKSLALFGDTEFF